MTTETYDEKHTRMINVAREIARTRGWPRHNVIFYEDDLIEIEASPTTPELEITRKPMPEKGMPGSNPCVMVNPKGECYRTHGEVRHIIDHILSLGNDNGNKG